MKIEQTAVFSAWFRKLKDRRARGEIAKRIELIRLKNHFGDHKPLGAGIYELRI